jgi:hypothetical protein
VHWHQAPSWKLKEVLEWEGVGGVELEHQGGAKRNYSQKRTLYPRRMNDPRVL